MELDLKIKYNKTYFYFAIFFGLVGLIFLIAAFMSFMDYSYLLELNGISGVPDNQFYKQLILDLRTDFILNIVFSSFSFGLCAFCSITRIRSSMKARRYADI